MKIKIGVSKGEIKHIQFMIKKMKDVYCEMTSEEDSDSAEEFFESLLETILTMEKICILLL